MPVSGVFRSDIREQALAVLLAANTAAGTRVYSPRTWPQSLDLLPALMVTTPAERKESMGPSFPRFMSTITLAIMARVRGTGIDAASMTASAEAALEALCDQVEQAVLCTPSMVAIVQEFKFVETHMVISAESETMIGEGTVIIGCEIFQQYEPPAGDPFTDLVTTVPASDAGAAVVFDSQPPQ